MELPKCEICGVRPAAYLRLRRKDEDMCVHFEVRRPDMDELVDVLVHACGGARIRKGRRLFDQPAGGNGYITWNGTSAWEEHRACPEATRILREMRAKQNTRLN